MRFRQVNRTVQALALVALVITSGCATVFVPSESTLEPYHMYPATAFDAQFFWHAGVKGEPLFATLDPHQRSNPLARVAYGAGAIIDLPLSLLFDTRFLPVDLLRLGTPGETQDGGQSGGGANESRPAGSDGNRFSSADRTSR